MPTFEYPPPGQLNRFGQTREQVDRFARRHMAKVFTKMREDSRVDPEDWQHLATLEHRIDTRRNWLEEHGDPGDETD